MAAPAPSRSTVVDPWWRRHGDVLLLASVFLLTLPVLAKRPGVGLDPSWQLGLHMARERGLTVGRDLFFTYGPWGFLTVPLTLTRGLWLASVGFQLAVQCTLFVAIGLWSREHLGRGRAYLALLPILLFAPPVEYRILLAIVLVLRLAIDAGRLAVFWACLAGLLGACLIPIRFSMGFAAMLVIAGAAVAAAMLGRRTIAAVVVAGYALGALVCGTVALGSWVALVEFLSVSWEISSGYTVALERRGPLWEPILVLLALGILLRGVLGQTRNEIRRALPILLPSVGLYLLAFKHGFVRHQSHGHIAFAVASVLLCWIAVELSLSGRPAARKQRLVAAAAICAATLLTSPPTHLLRLHRNAGDQIASVFRTFREMGDPGHREQLRAELRRQLPLHDDMLERIGNRTVDVMTVETALIEAWDLRWRPRRMLQSYVVARPELDDRDARFFAGPAAPERLLIGMQGLDTRHPFMDSPSTWREVLSRYEPIGWDDRWILLRRRAAPRLATVEPLGSVTVGLNESVRIPQIESGHLEMQVRIRPTWLGRIVGIPWKVPEVLLGLASSDGLPQNLRRVVPATATQFFPLVDPWPDAPDQLSRMFGLEPPGGPPGLALFTRGEWAWDRAEFSFARVEWRDAPLSTAAR